MDRRNFFKSAVAALAGLCLPLNLLRQWKFKSGATLTFSDSWDNSTTDVIGNLKKLREHAEKNTGMVFRSVPEFDPLDVDSLPWSEIVIDDHDCRQWYYGGGKLYRLNS